jgi:predicted acyltransferase
MRFLARHTDSIASGLDPNRLLSLDVMRGMTIAAMILVNNPGSWSYVYAPLAHAEWHGWTPTDLIFPFFIFIVGISLQLVMTRDAARRVARGEIMRRAVVRTVKLFALGLFLALFFFDVFDPAFNWIDDRLLQVRVMGVLQRIGLVYLATVLVVLCCRTTGRAVVAS